MKIKYSLIILFYAIAPALFAQEKFNPESQLMELINKKENIGIAAGYSIDGETKWSKSVGFACEEGAPFGTKTLTRIASIAKSFTAVAIMQLVEKGIIKLDDPINQYLKNLPTDKQAITIRQLMAHTSGLSQYIGDKEIENTIHFENLQEAMDVFIQRPLLSEPGVKYFYTSYGYVVLGRIIEEASGESYETYMQENIFDEAEMSNTGIEKFGVEYDNKSCLYHNKGKKAKPGKQNDLSNRIPGGGFYSSLDDLLKFGDALLSNKFISQESLERIIQAENVEYNGNKYALGWYLYGPPPNENLVIGHSGGQTGCTSQLMIIPKSKTVVVVLSNTSGTYHRIASFASKLIGYSESTKN